MSKASKKAATKRRDHSAAQPDAPSAAPLYDERLLAYVDILGWVAACRQLPPAPELAEALRIIHQQAASYSQATKSLVKKQVEGGTIYTELGAMPVKGTVNPMFLEVEFGAFSDHFTFSLPKSFGGRILGIDGMIRDLLSIGYATRGAVVLGPLHHRDNVIFGPALVEAVEIEEGEAFYPRILISDGVMEALEGLGHLSDPRHRPVIRDQTRRNVLNPFVLPFDGDEEEIWQLLEQHFDMPKIKAVIERNLKQLAKAKNGKLLEKWTYLHDFITGPVFESAPVLRSLWR